MTTWRYLCLCGSCITITDIAHRVEWTREAYLQDHRQAGCGKREESTRPASEDT